MPDLYGDGDNRPDYRDSMAFEDSLRRAEIREIEEKIEKEKENDKK